MARISCEEAINLFRQREEIEEKIQDLALVIVAAESEACNKKLKLSSYSGDDIVELVEYRGKQTVRIVAYDEYAERESLECSVEEFANPLLYYSRRYNAQKQWDLRRQESERKEDLAQYERLKAKLGL